jgi:tetratricopeptide (TPR) repeat protein
MFIQFEKKFGTREGIEDVILNKRRFQYEEDVIANPNSYDLWFDFIRLEEANGELNRIRDVYERAIANVPPPTEKRLWKRYVYLWINYAVFEELDAKDIPRAREVYKAIIELIPHKRYSLSSVANVQPMLIRLDTCNVVLTQHGFFSADSPLPSCGHCLPTSSSDKEILMLLEKYSAPLSAWPPRIKYIKLTSKWKCSLEISTEPACYSRSGSNGCPRTLPLGRSLPRSSRS